MSSGRHRRRITVDLGCAELYRSLKLAAVELDVTMREIIVEALREWLERRNGRLPGLGRLERGDG